MTHYKTTVQIKVDNLSRLTATQNHALLLTEHDKGVADYRVAPVFNLRDQESISPFGPLTLSSATKECFKIDDLSAENPSLLIPKEKIVEDIRNRSEESEFKHYEVQITNYPEDNLKLMLDVNKKYGEDYVLYLVPEVTEIPVDVKDAETEGTVEQVEETVKEQEHEEEESIEEQIEAEREMDTQPKIEITFILNEKVGRRPLELSSKMPSDNKDLYLEILPESEYYTSEGEEDTEVALEPIFRRTRDWGYQESIHLKTGYSQTVKPSLANACAQTEIKLFSESEKETIWKTPPMQKFLHTVENRLFDSLVEISAGGLEKPWTYLRSRESETASSRDAPLTVNCSYLCVSGDESCQITCVEWHPLLKDVFLVPTIQNTSFEEQVRNLTDRLLEPCLLYLWSTQDHLLPRLLLDSCDEVLCIKFNPTMPHLVVGGCSSGQLVLWDLSSQLQNLEKAVDYDWTRHTTSYDVTALGGNADSLKSPIAEHCVSSSIDHSHLLGTHCLIWIPADIEILPRGEIKVTDSTESFQVATCGFDGSLRFWDLRYKEEGVILIKSKFLPDTIYQSLDLNWKPFHVIDIPPPEGQKRLCLTKFFLKLAEKKFCDTETDVIEDEDGREKEKISTLFFAGTEDGKVFRCSFQLIKDETDNFKVPKPEYFTSVQDVHVHSGAIVGIYHSPFINDVFCSLGGRTMAIWNENLLKGPLFLDINKLTDITTGYWSLTRPAVFMLGLHDGSLQIWDLLQSCHQPVLLQSVASAAITSITTREVSESEQILAIGDGDGFVHILNLPLYLWKSSNDELPLFKSFLEREAKRVEMQMKEQVIIDAKKAAEAKKLEEERKREAEKAFEPEEEVAESSQENEELEFLEKNYKEFLKLERMYLIELGYIVEEAVPSESTDEGTIQSESSDS